VLVAILAVRPSREALLEGVLRLTPYPHGVVKALLEAWQLVLLRQGALGTALAAGLAVGLLSVAVPARLIWLGALLLGGAAALLSGVDGAPPVLALLTLLLLNLAPGALWNRRIRALRLLSWVPGSELLLPVPLARDLLARIHGGAARLAALPGLVGLMGLWCLADLGWRAGDHRAQLLAWPDERVDSRVQVLERAAPGVRGEYHDLELLGEHLVVVAEDSCRLLALPLDGGPALQRDLAPRWPPFNAGALDAWVDPDSQVLWSMDGPGQLAGLELTAEGWQQVAARRFDGPANFFYLVPAPEISRLLLVAVNAHDQEPGSLVAFRLPGLVLPERVALRTADDPIFPTSRDAAWIPPLQRLVLAPNFGARLYLADPLTGLVQPWIELYSANAKPLWVSGMERLLVAQPSASSIAVVDVASGQVERRIPTQPGVRAFAVDSQRGLLVSGSVLTGRILVQDLADGRVLDSFGTLMPMIREIALDPSRGRAVVASWTVLYSLPYLPDDEGDTERR